MNEVIIVGHGPSAYGRKLGDRIDQFENVVRMCHWLNIKINEYPTQTKEDFGSKIDYLVSTTRMVDSIADGEKHGYSQIPDKATWILGRCNEMTPLVYAMVRKKIPEYKVEFSDEMDHWIARNLSKLGARTGQWSQYIPWATRGTQAIIRAAHALKPKQITVIGFDDFRTADYNWHDWKAERELIKVAEKVFDFELVHL